MMAGDIFVSKDRHWAASSWNFYWAAEFLVNNVEDDKAAAWIREVIDEHIMIIDLDGDFTPPARRLILRLLRDKLIPDAEKRFSPDDPERGGALKILRELADLAREVAEQDRQS
ncbi:MAG TPA: hypothetical protein VGR06_18210 [Actinophytocola sp.]|jgi:hypothetical protein|uniref:hypothetical protein n=1 Tax=Actinophytocola sp. TaxID=1872138 RepID=UPI002E0844AC|nr:hypothetical protein [Actinophytocola sp.]